MAYDAVKIGNWLIERAKQDDRILSVMTILKLTYIAHGWHLTLCDGEPLYLNNTQAWRYGPVVPELYHAFQEQGLEVKNLARVKPDEAISGDAADLLPQIYRIYGKHESWYLSNLTHVEGGPWDIAVKSGGWFANIPNELIKLHYDKKLAEAEKNKNDR